jgi:hypothetical protein
MKAGWALRQTVKAQCSVNWITINILAGIIKIAEGFASTSRASQTAIPPASEKDTGDVQDHPHRHRSHRCTS